MIIDGIAELRESVYYINYTPADRHELLRDIMKLQRKFNRLVLAHNKNDA